MYLDETNVEKYLRSTGRIAPREIIRAFPLSGGVSNVTIYVSRPDGENFVIKQARPQLQVAEPWFCSVDRIWREVEVLHICRRIVNSEVGRSSLHTEVPNVLFEDRQSNLYAMSAAPTDHVVWKNELLAGRANLEVAAACGDLLGRLHRVTWNDRELAQRLDDRQFFVDLRLDPYYRHIGRVHTELKPALEELVNSVWREQHCLVHGDFSPKNLLLYDNTLMLIDFEVGHYGDPAFDLGFLLTHLVLKALYHVPNETPYFELTKSFWESYRTQLSIVTPSGELEALEHRMIQNFAGCALARIDGKSKVDYLKRELKREQVRNLCRTIFKQQPTSWNTVLQLTREMIASKATHDTEQSKP